MDNNQTLSKSTSAPADELVISLPEIARCLKKRWLLIVLVTVIATVAVFAYSYLTYKPKYESVATLYPNSTGQQSSGMTSSELTVSKSLIKTYGVILKYRSTLEAVIEKLDLPYDYKQLSKMVSSSAVNDTEYLAIKVVSKDPEESMKIANALAEVLPSKIEEQIEKTKVNKGEPAYLGEETERGLAKKTLLAAVIVFVIICALCIVNDIFINDTLDSEDWLASTFKDSIPVLATIPDSRSVNNKSKYGYSKYGYSRYGSYYQNHDKNGGNN